jgi:hypothetical protein
VELRPVSAQRVVLSRPAAAAWGTRGVDGPGLLTMCVGPAGAGKSEVKLAALRAGYDGEPFCSLETTRCPRVLYLSEMGAETLWPALARYGFGAEPVGRLDYVRLRYVAPLVDRGSAGLVVDVLYAADVYAPKLVDGELRQVEWPAVVLAAGDLCRRRGYKKLLVDSLGEWLGSDGNERMLTTLGACRQLTHAGIGVDLLHHTPRSDPYRPRGGTVIEAKLDVGISVTGLGAEGMPRSLEDPARELRWFKTRFPDQTPAGGRVQVERVWAGPGSGTRPRYRRAGPTPPSSTTTAPGAGARDPDSGPSPTVTPALPPQARQVWAALARFGPRGASNPDLQRATGLPRQRVHDALVTLCGSFGARQEGTFPAPPTGGIERARYVAIVQAGHREPEVGA